MDDTDEPIHEEMGTEAETAEAAAAQRRLTEALLQHAGVASVEELADLATEARP